MGLGNVWGKRVRYRSTGGWLAVFLGVSMVWGSLASASTITVEEIKAPSTAPEVEAVTSAPKFSAWQAVKNCASAVVAVGKTPLPAPVIKVLQQVAQAPIYPLVALVKSGYWTAKALRATTEDRPSVFQKAKASFKKDIAAVTMYMGLLFAANVSTLTYDAYDRQLNVRVNNQSNVAVFNGYRPSEHLHKFAAYRYQQRYHGVAAAKYYTPTSWDELFEDLLEYSSRYGKLDLIELHGHAVPGDLIISSENGSTPNKDPLNGDTLQLYMKSPNHSAENKFSSRTTWLVHQLRTRGILKPNGVVVLYGCSAGNGEKGYKLMTAIGGLLGQDGAKVYASEVMLESDFLDELLLTNGVTPPSGITDVLRQPVEYVMPWMRVIHMGINQARAEDPMTVSLHRVREVNIPPSAPENRFDSDPNLPSTPAKGLIDQLTR